MMYFLNLRTGVETIPLKEKTIRLLPGKPELIDDSMVEEMLHTAGDLIAEGLLKQITKKEAQDYLQKWEALKRIPAKETAGTSDLYLSASARYARMEARNEGYDANVKRREYYPAW